MYSWLDGFSSYSQDGQADTGNFIDLFAKLLSGAVHGAIDSSMMGYALGGYRHDNPQPILGSFDTGDAVRPYVFTPTPNSPGLQVLDAIAKGQSPDSRASTAVQRERNAIESRRQQESVGDEIKRLMEIRKRHFDNYGDIRPGHETAVKQIDDRIDSLSGLGENSEGYWPTGQNDTGQNIPETLFNQMLGLGYSEAEIQEWFKIGVVRNKSNVRKPLLGRLYRKIGLSKKTVAGL